MFTNLELVILLTGATAVVLSAKLLWRCLNELTDAGVYTPDKK